MFAPNLAHQIFAVWLLIQLAIQVDDLGIGDVFVAPVDVVIGGFKTYQPDLLFVSNMRHHIFDGHGIAGAPDVVVEILSDSTRRRDLNGKLPVYAANDVREVWIVDLEAATVSIHASYGTGLTPVRVFTAQDILVSDMMPGVSVDLGPIFARAQATP
ncbi:MAG: Uma2 family endonuclease [Dehalococcoidia bacterium]|nr:Uma2 family endonuclease [Dehalococcoidia bacterium]